MGGEHRQNTEDDPTPSGTSQNPAQRVLRLRPRTAPFELKGLVAIAGMGLVAVALAGLVDAWHPASAQPPDTVTARLKPDAEATLTSPLGEVQLYIEPGSVRSDRTLFYRDVSAWDIPDLPLGFVTTTKVFELSISTDEQSPNHAPSILKPGALTISLSDEEIAVAGSDESRVIIHHADSEQAQWTPIPTQVDFASNLAQARIQTLGRFALTVRWPVIVPDNPTEAKPSPNADASEPGRDAKFANQESDLRMAPLVQDLDRSPAPTLPVILVAERTYSSLSPAPKLTEDLSLTSVEYSPPAIILDTEIVADEEVYRPPGPTRVTLPPSTPQKNSLTVRMVRAPTPVPTQDWKLERVFARGDVVRVYVKILGPGLVAISLNGRETEEIKTVLPYQMHVFRAVPPGTHTVRVWTPGVARYERTTLVELHALTPTPKSPATATHRPIPTRQPRYRLFINNIQVPAQNLMVLIGDGSVTLSQAPSPDGRYAAGERVIVLASPKSGWPYSWGGVDSHDGLFGKVHMVADRFVSVKIGPPPPTPKLVFKKSRTTVSNSESIRAPVVTPRPTPEPTPVPTPEPTPEPTPVPTPEPTPEPTPVPTPELEGQIVFASNRHGNYEIYVVDANGSDLKRLTEEPADDRHPVWSPDGSKIAFESQRDGNWELYVMDSDGINIFRLISNLRDDQYPAWSPDGTEIAFESNRDGHREIYSMFPSGRRQMNVSRSSEDEIRPEWSPDGAKLAFNRPNGNGHDIYTMDVGNWGMATQLTSDIDAKGPKWSPNGVTLAFTSDAGGSPHISTIGSDGTGSLSLTPDHNAWSPAWSPDGSHLVYTSDKAGSEDLFVISADGSGHVRITDDPAADTDPDWKR